MPPVRTRVRLSAVCLALISTLALSSSSSAAPPNAYELVRNALAPSVIKDRLNRYAPVDLGLSKGKKVPDQLQPMLKPLKRAADAVDRVFWQQVSSDGLAIYKALSAAKADAAQNLAKYMRIHAGIWDRHANDEPFISQRARPAGANFYPSDMSRREIEAYISSHPKEAPRLWSPYTVVKRNNSKLVAQPYSKAYKADLKAAGVALREAASAYKCGNGPASEGALPPDCPCAGLARFLEARADSFNTDDYRKSELMWVASTTCPLDIAIGPYEYYEDRLLGLKTAYEAIVTFRDERDTARFEMLQQHQQGLFENLPLPNGLRSRFLRVKPAQITVGDVLYTAGDASVGYQIRAFLLPNDDVVRQTRGTKSMILRNVVRAKFDQLVKPVAQQLLPPKAMKQLSFDAYFDILLTWQFAHTLVPDAIVLPDRTTTTSQQQLRERYAIIELLKGEVVALANYFYLAGKGVIGSRDPTKMGYTYLASLFDSARLAAGSPQTVAKTIIYNYLAHEWVFRYNPRTQTFEVNPPAMPAAVRKLAAETLQVLGRGDYQGAGRLIVEFGIMPPEMRQKLSTLAKLPVDIRPRYTSM